MTDMMMMKGLQVNPKYRREIVLYFNNRKKNISGIPRIHETFTFYS
jgi:hypothetical protein